MTTGFFWDEKCFWHGGGQYAFTMPAGGLVQPDPSGLPENPETKRRLKNLIEVTGLIRELDAMSAESANWEQLQRVHPEAYLREFKQLSEGRGGELGLRTPFGAGGFDIAAQSAGLAIRALSSVLDGTHANSYALTRPPGHHCLPDFPNGFCLLANIAIAVHVARDAKLCERVVVLDWDVHHGNGTEAIFFDDPDVLTISIHQERNYPLDTGDVTERGEGKGEGANINIPLTPGAGHQTYLRAYDQIVEPAIRAFAPDVIIVACGYDAAAVDPLSRMLATASTFGAMTHRTMRLADKLCEGKLALVHEGGYSEAYVPFCGHAVLAALSGSSILAPDPLAEMLKARQPGADFQNFLDQQVDELARFFGN